MKRLNRLFPVLTLAFGVLISSTAVAQDSTKARIQNPKGNKAKVTANAKAPNKNKIQHEDRGQKGQPGQPGQQGQPGMHQPMHGKMHHGNRFVDKDGDGYNDNAPDHDGDGIPNGLDPDYMGPRMHGGRGMHGFIDLDGDGINDNMMNWMHQSGGRKGHGHMGGMMGQKGGHGPGDGTGNQGVRPQDGTGHGSRMGMNPGNHNNRSQGGKRHQGGKGN